MAAYQLDSIEGIIANTDQLDLIEGIEKSINAADTTAIVAASNPVLGNLGKRKNRSIHADNLAMQAASFTIRFNDGKYLNSDWVDKAFNLDEEVYKEFNLRKDEEENSDIPRDRYVSITDEEMEKVTRQLALTLYNDRLAISSLLANLYPIKPLYVYFSLDKKKYWRAKIRANTDEIEYELPGPAAWWNIKGFEKNAEFEEADCDLILFQRVMQLIWKKDEPAPKLFYGVKDGDTELRSFPNSMLKFMSFDDTPGLLDAPYMRQATSFLFSFAFFVFSHSPLLTYELWFTSPWRFYLRYSQQQEANQNPLRIDWNRKKTSSVWTGFVQAAEKSTGEPIICYKKCDRALKHPKLKASGTKALADHQKTDVCKRVTHLSRGTLSHQDLKSAFRKGVLDVILSTRSSFRIVNNPDWKSLCELQNPHLKLPSASTIKRDLDDRILEINRHLLDNLPANQKLSISLDYWSSTKRYSFIFIHVEFNHTREELARIIHERLTKLGLTERIIAITTDNASSNNTMIKELPKCVEDAFEKKLFISQEIPHVPCIAHVLQLSLKALLGPRLSPTNESLEKH
ncbi:hypothetical protein MBM_00060 [Drepanopeziza brunnea f. sp. 'multigermtubi' MB_m1]|uniref:Transposase n=1 Tax=Marssonina brunnea f. sp. multigermtubi (strain MB_m1) TaxID=1072389 RepID=K1X763_MARBU|nr:uncharacterized protein MBM_00060 [Drepanopeziza brunnea f. sp. 'multigermtubi' MB_m1]EKD20947.1 hypothetical protein MBM_00060 [Drepanopeziza brunnea f. sp. 'multigermtubi' MB_m1]